MSSAQSEKKLRSFRNDPSDFLAEALGGFVASHPDAEWHTNGFIGRATPITTDDGGPAVAIVSGGGSGHEPMHAGFLGAGMLSAVCPGLLFTSPNAVQITEATRWADQGEGVLHIVKNYTGDVMNFTVARQSLDEVDTRVVLVADDVATGSESDGDDDETDHGGVDDSGADNGESDNGGEDDGSDGPGRRGTGATILVEKIAGAAAQRGDGLDEVAELAQWVADNSRSMAAALAPGHLPTSGRDTFDLTEGNMEVGVGIHGERGVAREDAETADVVVDKLLSAVVEALDLSDGDEVICLVNNLGGSTPLEMSLVYGSALQWLAQRGIKVRRSLVGTFVTSVNMAGVSITLTRCSEEVLNLLDANTSAPGWPRVLGEETDYAPAKTDFDDAMPTGGEENAWLSGFVERVQGATEDLTELDRLAGDGDFGTNMEAAFSGIELPVTGSDGEVLDAIGKRLFIRAGGTSGAVLGTLFRELGAAMGGGEDKKEQEAAGANASGAGDDGAEGTRAEQLAAGLGAARDAIGELGGAKQGDNTLMDALIPAVEAVQKAAESSADDFDAVLEQGYSAAEEGALSTREMVAKKGRASYLGDASKGVVDPGAIFISWLFGGSGKVSDFDA
ncbi:PTS-dependent dihydroxyacetone kinase, dihydroxyacetone-binding subunit DhaK [Corynebacterium heidelbergense]|uniref:dihydroxyacetone kinase subunit DhaK n=1 Tax=Corynebacterium heidelbergense TaxID=2055947 RepID=UPI0023583264|nr:dihydroxyacetone kinase subunit DhaK [Corynebacterium heidelbergense]WCZ37100.1 PTS-dependent dihydroxyacetone kinase, dihydroxyacetone-binding subunit DhaK [Corynebacterium heidelbergense]